MDFLYVVSKVFTFFLSPFYWILILLVWRYFAKLRGTKQRLSIIAVCVFIVFSNDAFFKTAVNAWQPKPVNLQTNHYEAGIVLGGMSGFDKDRRGFFKDASDRFYQGCELYNAGTIKKVIVTGGTVAKNKPEEADFIKTEMIKMGVRPDDVIAETRSKTTRENAIYTKQIIDSLHIPAPYVLITSAEHIPRASRLFENVGLKVIPYPCAYEVIDEELTLDDYLIPKVKTLDSWQRFIKEMIGSIIYKMKK
jgi:uncharacterized SAM-binding protein YcdF (DUF218 family)